MRRDWIVPTLSGAHSSPCDGGQGRTVNAETRQRRGGTQELRRDTEQPGFHQSYWSNSSLSHPSLMYTRNSFSWLHKPFFSSVVFGISCLGRGWWRWIFTEESFHGNCGFTATCNQGNVNTFPGCTVVHRWPSLGNFFLIRITINFLTQVCQYKQGICLRCVFAFHLC